MAIKIIIRADIGRKSKGCSGWGICSLEVEVGLSAFRPNQILGILEWEQGASVVRLRFRDEESLAEKGIYALPVDVPLNVPLRCNGGIHWVARPGLYRVGTDNAGEFIDLDLSAVHARD